MGPGAARAIAAGALGALLLAGCGRQAAAPPAALPEPKFVTTILAPATVPAERELDGAVEAVNQATVAAQTAGRVAGIYYDVNDRVPAGAVLLRIRGTVQRAGLTEARAALAEAQARAAEAGARYERIRGMYERKVVARAQFDQATAERDAAAARVSAAGAALAAAREGLDYTEVRAPYAGIVTARHVRVGEAVAPGTPLISGVALDRLRVTADVPQSLVDPIRKTGRAAVYADGRRLDATRVTVFPEADPLSGTFRTRVELPPDSPGLYPGMFVKVAFVTGEDTRLLVPVPAVVRRSEMTGVYVVGPDNRIALRQVRLGRAYPAIGPAGSLEVLSGLAAGERIALDPQAAALALGAAPGPDG